MPPPPLASPETGARAAVQMPLRVDSVQLGGYPAGRRLPRRIRLRYRPGKIESSYDLTRRLVALSLPMVRLDSTTSHSIQHMPERHRPSDLCDNFDGVVFNQAWNGRGRTCRIRNARGSGSVRKIIKEALRRVA